MKLRLIAATVTSLALTSGALAQEQPTDAELLSYALGYSFGSNNLHSMMERGETLDIEWVIKGLREGFEAKKPSVPVDRMQQSTAAYQARDAQRMKEANEQYQKLKASNLQRSNEFLKENLKKPGVRELSPGLQYRIITEGKGAKPTLEDRIKIRLKGPFPFGERQEQQEEEQRGQVKETPLKGLATALTHMPVGSTWEITLAPQWALGENHYGLPNGTLVLEVTLLAIE